MANLDDFLDRLAADPRGCINDVAQTWLSLWDAYSINLVNSSVTEFIGGYIVEVYVVIKPSTGSSIYQTKCELFSNSTIVAEQEFELVLGAFDLWRAYFEGVYPEPNAVRTSVDFWDAGAEMPTTITQVDLL